MILATKLLTEKTLQTKECPSRQFSIMFPQSAWIVSNRRETTVIDTGWNVYCDKLVQTEKIYY